MNENAETLLKKLMEDSTKSPESSKQNTVKLPQHPEILMSFRFKKNYKKANAALQGLIEGAVKDLIRRIRSDKTSFMRQYDRIRGLTRTDVLEIDVSGANRLIALWDAGCVRLLDVGGHEIPSRYNDGKLILDIKQDNKAPEVFWPEGATHGLRFFTDQPCLVYEEYECEQQSEWLYFLSEQQREIVDEIALQFDLQYERGESYPATLILGGPGTGKTSVLINLLKEFTDFGFKARIVLSDRVLRFVNASLPEIDIKSLQWDEAGDDRIDALLVDDPDNRENIASWLSMARSGNVGTVVIGFDPCQLSPTGPKASASGLTDADFNHMCQNFGVHTYGLDQCYRQKENVGKAVKKKLDIIAKSTPFLAVDKIEHFHEAHRGLTLQSNDLRFMNPHGYCRVHAPASQEQFSDEVRRIQEKPLWRHWPPLLIAIDIQSDRESSDVAWVWQEINKLPEGMCEVVSIDAFNTIKGLEFQHVFLLIRESLYLELENGFSGTGRRAYADRRLMRIPLSRAKDSLVVFVL